LTLHTLRLRIGDDLFFETLRAYTGRFHDGNASTEDFVGVAERVSGQDLGDLFQAWLFERPVPDIPEMELYREDFQP
jgi:aminopeptidase N